MKRKQREGKIIVPAKANPWSHEMRVAKILAQAGYMVEFIPETNLKTPDIYLDKTEYEIKSPITTNPKKIVRNVKRALEKCPNVIIDSSRIKGVKNASTQKLLENKTKDLPKLKKLIFITKNGRIIDIKG